LAAAASCLQDTGVLPQLNAAGAAGHMRGYAEGRHGPSKLRMSSSDHSSNIPASAALAAAGMQVWLWMQLKQLCMCHKVDVWELLCLLLHHVRQNRLSLRTTPRTTTSLHTSTF
jgi:hypothetical protein